MERKKYDTITETMTGLKKLGYTNDFSIMTDRKCLFSHLTATELSPDEFKIDNFYRFEGENDPGDSMMVYAISSIDQNLKGVVVNAYGDYPDNALSGNVKKLNGHPKQGKVNVFENLTPYYKIHMDKKESPFPKDTYSRCWGHRPYNGKILNLLKDKQIDVDKHKNPYTLIKNILKHRRNQVEMRYRKGLPQLLDRVKYK